MSYWLRNLFVDISGAPASRKTTIAAELTAYLSLNASVLLIGSFDLDKLPLSERGLSARNGVPRDLVHKGLLGYSRELAA
jgi:hypothetical protein